MKADIVLLSIGRRPYSDGLGAAEAGIETDDRFRVKTNGHFATSVPGIWAISDVTAGPILAHKAEEEGVALAEIQWQFIGRLGCCAGHRLKRQPGAKRSKGDPCPRSR
jgi:pyruvate/2-oxoglutarate dehydrogenase complex dihydrolipoamide dehydrogenase (E3) component